MRQALANIFARPGAVAALPMLVVVTVTA